MRVTDRLRFQNAQLYASTASESMQTAYDQLSSGIRVVQPGDDPIAAGLIVSFNAQIARMKAIADSAQRAADELNYADGAMEQMTVLLHRAHDLAVQFTNGSYGAEERASAAPEIGQLFEQMIAVLNTQVAGRYIFSGDLDTTQPFDGSGTYQGDDNIRQIEIAPGVLGNTSINMNIWIKGSTGGVDVLTALTDFEAALTANDADGIAAALSNLDTGITQLTSARASGGAATNTLQTAISASQAGVTQNQKSVANLEDTDIVEATSRLALAQHALQATLAATQQTLSLSLLNIGGGGAL